ncbi:MAG: hypothetical protein ACE5EZ_01245 [Thermodesulfobacteriota bacterium]
MRLVASASALVLFLSVFMLPPQAAYGAGQSTLFNSYESVSRWRFEHVDEARFIDGGLLLKGNNFVKISPPAGFHAPIRRVAMDLRFKTSKSFVTNLSVRGSDGWVAGKYIKVNVLDGSEKITHLRVYFGKHDGGGAEAYINDFILEFVSSENINVRLDSLRIYEPTTSELLSLLWEEFWRPDFITGSTVGFVTTPEAGGVGFMGMLYVLVAITFASVVIFYRLSRRPLSARMASSALVLIVILAGVIFTVRMDYNWLTIWRDDVKTLSGVGVDERIRIVHNRNLDSFFDFIDLVKRTVPSGSAIRHAASDHNTQLSYIARYYMLPIEDSVKADLLWLYGDSLVFDPGSGALYDGNGKLVAPKVKLFAKYAENAAIYEVIK